MKDPSHPTRNVLFALSGNQCAHPDCRLPVTERRTVPVAEVCHIHPKQQGNPVHPRWNPSLSEDELNHISNLILLCRHHHRVVDRSEPGLYSAELLREWKDAHEERNSSPQYGHSSSSVVDRAIRSDLEEIRRGRFLRDFGTTQRCLQLGTALTSGEYSAGTPGVRGRALAWCARLLAPTDKLPRAKELLQRAEELVGGDEVTIATALILSQEKDLQDALNLLASVESPMSRSAALEVVFHKSGAETAVQRAHDAGLEVTDLDADGRTCLLAGLLELEDWDRARSVAGVVVAQTDDHPPALNQLTALAHLLQTVPVELREPVRTQVPLFTAGLLASDQSALRCRRVAYRHFRAAASAARDLGCTTAADLSEEYALWLELLDPERRPGARLELRMKLQKPAQHLRLVHLAVQFGVEFDPEETNQAIRREIAKRGGASPATAAARLALAATLGAPSAVADYIAQHREEFAGSAEHPALLMEAIALAQAGAVEQARSRLDHLLESGLSPIEAEHLRAAIASAESEDRTASAKRRFKETDSLTDLQGLVADLSGSGAAAELCHYAELLFERTHSVEHAESFAMTLAEAREYSRLAEFLNASPELLEQSDRLKLCFCWSRFYQGSLLEARDRLQALSDLRADPNYRHLEIQLAIHLGDWESLSTIVESEFQARKDRDWQDLAAAARLAAGLGLPRAKELAFAAADQAKDNPGALAGIHLLAVQAGWDDEPEVGTWLNRAVTLSGADGPLQRVSLPTLISERPKWQERRMNLLGQLDRGEIPTFLAASVLNRPLSSLMLLPAIANRPETDPRRRHPVAAYSGKRPRVHCDPSARAAFDAAALLTLGLLNLVDEALDAFDVVHLPHSTLAWLFEEKQNVSFHQPRLVREARRIRHLLSKREISELDPKSQVDSELASQVGSELATLIAEAEANQGTAEQCFVVRPSPVHRIDSLMEEEADLTRHEALLSSCQAVIDSLQADSVLTAEQHRAASWYLGRSEQPWPRQPAVSAPATLYLDDLATTYFLHLNVLDVLADAGFTVFVAPSTASEADSLLAYDELTGEVGQILEKVRAAVSKRIADGHIRVGPVGPPAPSEGPDSAHPTMDLFTLTDRSDVVVTDERFINRHPHVDGQDQAVPTVSTLDVLDMLASSGGITTADRLTYRTRLRRFGYLFVPVEEDELLRHLTNSAVKDGQVNERLDLRAVRENLLVARMGEHLQLPDELQWLADTTGAFVSALGGLWLGDPDVPDAQVRSDWILHQIDVRGWTHRLPPDGASRSMESDRAEQLVRLLLPHRDVTPTVREQYWDWVETRLLKPIQETEPALYSWLAERFLLTVSQVADDAEGTMELADE